MEENIEIGLLYEFYSQLITQKQQYVIDSYYNNDLSLSEIAQEIGISRQGVQKQLKDAKKVLYNYEDKLQLLNKFLNNKKIIEKMYDELNILEKKYSESSKTIQSIKNELEKLN